MSFISIILFLIKYGPAIVELIKAAIDLIKWLRKNDEERVEFADEASVKSRLEGMAKRCKQKKDTQELRDYVEKLRARKAEVERKKKGG